MKKRQRIVIIYLFWSTKTTGVILERIVKPRHSFYLFMYLHFRETDNFGKLSIKNISL